MNPEEVDWIDPQLAITLAIIFWTIFIIQVLVSTRRAKVRRDRAMRISQDMSRRDAYIQEALDREDEEP